MKAITNRTDLLKALQILRLVAKPGEFIPVASGVMIAGAGERLTLTADNRETMCHLVIPAAIGGEGGVVVSADRLGRLLTFASDDNVKIDVKDGKSADLICGGVKAHLAGWSPDDFLQREEFKEESSFQVGLAELKSAFSRVEPALMSFGPQTVRHGVHLVGRNGKLTIEACDGRALHAVSLGSSVSINAILPPSVAGLIKSIDGEEECRVAVNSNAIQFEVAGKIIQAQLLEGFYPNTEQIVPAPSENFISLPKDGLIRAIQVARTVMDAKGANRLSVSAKKEAVTISSYLCENGDVQEVIETPNSYEVDFFAGAEILLNAVKQIKGKEVQIQCDEPTMAICIREDDLLVIIATMRIPPTIEQTNP